MKITKIILLALCVLVQHAMGAGNSSPRKPNIIWIWADNLAYADLGIYGNDKIKTPVIDRLARGGVRFTQYYVAHTVCSPSRAALLTGRQPFRVGIVDVLRPDGPTGIPAEEITLAEALRQQGYATAAIGKWHLGDHKEFLPCQNGFDTYLGLPYSMDMLPTLLYEDNKILEELPGDKVRNVTERFVDKAIEFINASKERPFFLYFSHTIPHPPLNLPAKYRNPSRPIYDDAIEYMDMLTGRLLDAVEQNGLSDNTLVFFSSDNGPMVKEGKTGGLRGGIRDSYEGGLRVPLVAYWPNRIPAGKVVDTPTIAYDIFPTLVQLAGGRLARDRAYDGQDIRPLLTGQGSFERGKPFIWVYLDKVTAIRDGRWKLHVGKREKPLKQPELYDLNSDPYEAKSVNGQHPEVVERLRKTIRDFEAQIPKVWPLQYPVRDPAKIKGGIRRK
jgi:arylsulfatase